MGKPRILIIEDESIVALDIQGHLQRNGYEVLGIFSSGENALEKLPDQLPDIVLMDIRLQGQMDGVEAGQIIRNTYGIPVILLTAYADDETIERAKLSEPFGYLVKPFEERELKTTIEMALHRSRLEKKLHESEERYRKLFEDDLSGNFIATEEGDIIDCNPSFVKMFGFSSRDEAISANLSDMFLLKEQYKENWEILTEKKQLKFIEMTILSKQKKPLEIMATLIADVFDDGSIKEVKGYFIDMTEMKRLEQQLLQSQKMEAVGRLAGGIAHDFNNLLTVILGYSSMLMDRSTGNESMSEEVNGIQTAAKKASSLTRQLLTLSRKQILTPKPVDLNVLIGDMERMFERLINENISLQLFLDAENTVIIIDPGQLEQVLLNLVVNAKDAMPNGGTLRIETRNERIFERITSINGTIEPGYYVIISCADSGTGIEKVIMDKVFEPFFTTKPVETGTGLGLSMVYGIIQQSQGWITVESEPGKGTAFNFFFRSSEKSSKKTIEKPKLVPESRGDETILLVEDESNVRDLVLRMLESQGYHILEAENAGEALLICENFESRIHLLLSDIVMPVMNGDKLAVRLKTIRPDIKVLLMSGYPDKEANELTLGSRGIDFIAKPFNIEELAVKVRKVLDRAP
ncbi:MAG: response regulator [Spirochaetales bacterium]|nr:response regulator [Spirochaetales bacterium]